MMDIKYAIWAHSYPRNPQVIQYLGIDKTPKGVYVPSKAYTKEVVIAKFYASIDDILISIDKDIHSNTLRNITFTHDNNDNIITGTDDIGEYVQVYIRKDCISLIKNNLIRYI